MFLRIYSLPYEHLIGNDDLRLFYDPLLVPVSSNDQPNPFAIGTLPPSAESTKSDQPNASPTFLLQELEQSTNEEEKETWEIENVDRSAFLQELFLSTLFEPTQDNIQDFRQQPIDSNAPSADSLLLTAPSFVMNFVQQPSIEITRDRFSAMPSSSSDITLLDNRTIQRQSVSSPSSPDASEKLPSRDNFL